MDPCVWRMEAMLAKKHACCLTGPMRVENGSYANLCVLKSLYAALLDLCKEYKVISLTYNTLQSSQPSYLRQLFTIQPPRSTRSSSTLTLPRTCVPSSLKFSNGSIAVAVLPLWNKLPPALRQISDPSYELTQTSPLAISLQLFHSKLKTLLLSKTYPDLSSSSYLPPPSQLQTPSTITV